MLSHCEHLLLQLLPVDVYGLLRPFFMAIVVVLLLLWMSTSSSTTGGCVDHSLLSTVWVRARSLIDAAADTVETATTGAASPPTPQRLPGPRGLPFVGFLPFVGKLPHLSLARIAQRYAGRAFRLAVGCRRYVVINKIETVRELARRYPKQLRGKPRTFTTDQMTLGAHNDLVQRWKRRRAYTEAGLKILEQNSVGAMVSAEVSQLINDLDRMVANGSAADIRHDLAMYAGRTMYRIAYGRVPDSNAVAGLSRIVDTLPDYTTTIGSLSWFDVLPFWRKIRAGCFKRFVEFNKVAAAFCRQAKNIRLAEDPEASGDDDRSKDDEKACNSLLDFFRLRWRRMPAAEAARFSLTDDILYDGLEDIIRAGTESTSLIIKWFLLYVASFPEVQQRMQAEIDAFLDHSAQTGDDDDDDGEPTKERRQLSADDLPRLVYCRAALMETFRFSALNPFLKRELTDDILLPADPEDENPEDEIHLPRGTVLLYNTWAINNDRRHWTEPESFRPERFLRRKDGATETEMEFDESKMDLFVPFGFGKRRCIGVDTGRRVCMLVIASLVERYNIRLELVDNARGPDLEPIFGIGLAPKSYRVVMTRRQR